MAARHIPCGEVANESERQAIERLRSKLPDGWILLSNVAHSLNESYLSDEIDLIAIGPSGITVIEVKHWDLDYVRRQASRAEAEAERINDKAKRVAAKVRAKVDAGFIRPSFLLTRPGTGLAGGQRWQVRGVPFFGLTEWKELTQADGAQRLGPEQLQTAAKLIEPTTRVAISGEVRRFGELINLERIPTANAPFHRAYRGQHCRTRDRAILHLFDLSAAEGKQAETLARREFDVVQRWQKSPYIPSLLESFREAEHYAGELYYFSLLETDAPSVRTRSADPQWTLDERLRFAHDSLLALHSFHSPPEREMEPLLHRQITPDKLHVRHNNQPLFTGFELARLGGAETISTAAQPSVSDWLAPEVAQGGFAVADARSDTYALCKTLAILFTPEHKAGQDALDWLSFGCAPDPAKRSSLTEIAAGLERNTRPFVASAQVVLPAPEYWDEDTEVDFKQSRFRVISRLGSGGIGQTFKVVELSPSGDEFGTYVAKLISKKADADRALPAYRKARQHTTHPHLAALHEIASSSDWRPDRFAALLKWVDGTPLADWAGLIAERAEELGEPDVQALVLRWLFSVCDGLSQFHAVGLVHGDVSPRNLIECAGNVVLTDYDTVTETGQRQPIHNPLYCSAELESGAVANPGDDVFALAASLFQVLFDREPFRFGAERHKDRGLNWEGIDAGAWPIVRRFLDRATHPESTQRFVDARAACSALVLLQAPTPPFGRQTVPSTDIPPPNVAPRLDRQTAPRLRELLSAYPGSRHGNAETRGLDSPFAEQTYVETELDRRLRAEVERGEVDLVILFGNAGDGKTAFLQNLAENLVGSRPESKQRLWETRLANGRKLALNLDGSAAYQGQTANALLDEFLKPFQSRQHGQPKPFTKALAINSGKMLEWIEARDEDTAFTAHLRATLFNADEDAPQPDTRLRLVDLNRRSLVGGYAANGTASPGNFLNQLLDRFLGGEPASAGDPWQNCIRCAAQARCTAWASVQALRTPQAQLLRERLADAFQAAHLRGEIHITARELRAALAFIFFGLHDCEELHDNPELQPPPYWQRVFAASGTAAEGRQGELLSELVLLDPALNADPMLDRLLLQTLPAEQRGDPHALAAARRRAYFEWDEARFAAHHLPRSALALHGAEHLDRFRRVPTMDETEKADLCQELCQGIARLEDLPEAAFRLRALPLRVTPRTPTESCFWVLKPHERFTLSAPLPQAVAGLEVLHTHLLLSYRHPNGRMEQLAIGLELFHLLLALKSGAQLMGSAQEGVFAHLDLFVQRVTQEDVRELYAWHPEQPQAVSRLKLELRDRTQTLCHELLAAEHKP